MIEQFVPTQETCSLLRWENETYFVWAYSSVLHNKWHLYRKNELQLFGRIPFESYNAPMLQEVLEDLALNPQRQPQIERIGEYWTIGAWDIVPPTEVLREQSKWIEKTHSNPTEAAALLRLELQK